MEKQLNFNNQRDKLTEKDIDQLIDIVGSRCRAKTKDRLRSILKYGIHTIGHFGILDRLIKEGDGWSYCAGQSYPDEIRTVRGLILKGD